MEDFNYIKEEEFKRRNHLLEQFEDNGLEKAISQEEFNTKYGIGHQVFTMEGINKFVENATKEDASDEVVKAIEDELKTLSKVVVKTDEGFEARYVREEVIAKGEDGDEDDEDEDSDEDEDEDDEEKGLKKGKKKPADKVKKGEGDDSDDDDSDEDDSVEKGDFGAEIAKSQEEIEE